MNSEENKSHKGKILIVDDEQLIRRLVFSALKRETSENGTPLYEFSFASDGEHALKLIQDERPDVVLLDLMMPEIEGDKLCEMIKLNLELRDTRIIVVSAKNTSMDRVDTLMKGADDYICKPFNSSELCARVRIQFIHKRIEDQLRKSLRRAQHEQALGKLTSGIVHDFNNILQNMGIHEIMSYELDDLRLRLEETQKRHKNDVATLGLMEESLKLLENLKIHCGQLEEVKFVGEAITRGLLAYARKHDGEHVSSSIEDLIRSPLGIFQRQIKQSNIKVYDEIEAGIPSILCNPSEIQQVVLNLLSNALYAMENSSIKKLTLQAWEADPWVCFSIGDTGQGIPKEIQGKIFNHLFTTKETEGTGIGLAAVKQIIDSHDGNIQFSSAPNEGTTFIVKLPLKQQETPENSGPTIK